MNTRASAMGTNIGINPSIFSVTLCSDSGGNSCLSFTSGVTTSIVPMPLLIGLHSPSGRQFHERAESRLERPSIAVGVTSDIHPGPVPVGFDHRPHSFVGKEEHAA